MNQGIAFARTLRALDADEFRASKLGLAAAAILLAAWAWWMIGARVPQYESTTNVRLENGHAIAYFPTAELDRIQAGQSAIVHSNGMAFAARVQSITSDYAELVLAANPQSPIPAASAATAEVEVSRVSPAAIALQSLGRRNR
jgi:hypothetical protein